MGSEGSPTTNRRTEQLRRRRRSVRISQTTIQTQTQGRGRLEGANRNRRPWAHPEARHGIILIGRRWSDSDEGGGGVVLGFTRSSTGRCGRVCGTSSAALIISIQDSVGSFSNKQKFWKWGIDRRRGGWTNGAPRRCLIYSVPIVVEDLQSDKPPIAEGY